MAWHGWGLSLHPEQPVLAWVDVPMEGFKYQIIRCQGTLGHGLLSPLGALPCFSFTKVEQPQPLTPTTSCFLLLVHQQHLAFRHGWCRKGHVTELGCLRSVSNSRLTVFTLKERKKLNYPSNGEVWILMVTKEGFIKYIFTGTGQAAETLNCL